ncbi:MAG: hypothetical protein R3B81_02785 [bacterium]
MTESHHLSPDLLIDLAHEAVPAGERVAALRHLATCVDCEDRFRREVADRERLRSRLEAGLAVRPARDGSRTIGWLIPAGLAVAALLLLSWLPRSPGPGESGRDRLAGVLPGEIERVVVRGAADDVLLERTARAATARDWETVLRLTSTLPPDPLGTSPLGFYRAAAFLETGDAERAVEAITRVRVESTPAPWRQRGYWIRALALVDLGQTDAARRDLAVVEAEGGSLGERAAALSQRLQSSNPATSPNAAQ